MIQAKIQDTGKAPLYGRQEEYWIGRLNPKYTGLRPDYQFKNTPQAKVMTTGNIIALEFGHYTTQDERFNFLACAEASIKDLKKILGFKNIGFDKIGVAYGARGMGGAAAAHFEPGSNMINLTRKDGFGSFAHEYGHAIDYIFGGYIDQVPGFFSLSGGHSTSTRPMGNFPAQSLRGLMDNVMQSVIWKSDKTYSDMYAWVKKNTEPGGYWQRRTELFARAFEVYVNYKLKQKGIKNTFLTKKKYNAEVYLTEADFKRVLPHMEKLIKKMASYTK